MTTNKESPDKGAMSRTVISENGDGCAHCGKSGSVYPRCPVCGEVGRAIFPQPESPDSGAGALAPIENNEFYKDRFYIPLPGGWEIQTKGSGSSFRICNTTTGDRLNVCPQPYLYELLEKMGREIHAAWNTRAQDSGQGEAVAVGGHLVSGFPPDVAQIINDHWDELFDETHPPKPAQDAAGNGVEEVVDVVPNDYLQSGVMDLSEPSDAPVLDSPAQIGNTVFHVGVKQSTVIKRAQREYAYRQAKPAQVGEKYREPTIEDAKRLWDEFSAHPALAYDAWLYALKAIGAVVPAQDGGV